MQATKDSARDSTVAAPWTPGLDHPGHGDAERLLLHGLRRTIKAREASTTLQAFFAVFFPSSRESDRCLRPKRKSTRFAKLDYDLPSGGPGARSTVLALDARFRKHGRTVWSTRQLQAGGKSCYGNLISYFPNTTLSCPPLQVAGK